MKIILEINEKEQNKCSFKNSLFFIDIIFLSMRSPILFIESHRRTQINNDRIFIYICIIRKVLLTINMNLCKINFLDLPNEILLIILKKLDNMDVLYSFFDVYNQRLERLMIFYRYLIQYLIDSAFPYCQEFIIMLNLLFLVQNR